MIAQWMEKLPVDWCVVPFGSLFEQSKRKNIFLDRDYVLSLMKDIGVIPYEEKGNVGNKVSDDLSGYKLVDKGDFVLNPMNLYVGSVGVSDYEGVTSNAYIVCKPSSEICSRYYKYLIQCRGFQEYVGLLGNGIMDIREAVRWTVLKSVKIPLPNLKIQREIADFLDSETARIDKLIEKKTKLILLLIEKRKSVISSAVTCRKNYDIGENKCGNSYRLKYLLQMKYGDALASDMRIQGDVIVYGSNGSVGKHNQRNTKMPAIIVGRKGSHGKITWAPDGGFCIDTAFYIDNVSCKGVLRYVYYLLQSLELDASSKDSAVPGLNRFDAHNKVIMQIDIITQKSIADFLDSETGKLDAIVEKTKKSIELLKEFRSSLITEAVTGHLNIQKRGVK